MNTHAHKAESYVKGRPDYPEAFFDFLYDEAGFRTESVIADIGCGPGNVTKFFLMRGNPVIAIEPDGDMLRIADKKLSGHSKYQSYQRTAEDTGIASGSIDHIFCGNAYHWFHREQVIPEFKRILREGGSVAIATLGSGSNVALGTTPPFLPGAALEKTFTYVIQEDFEQFLHGSLSTSSAPSPGDQAYEKFCRGVRRQFKKHSKNGIMEVEMRLVCATGSAKHLAL